MSGYLIKPEMLQVGGLYNTVHAIGRCFRVKTNLKVVSLSKFIEHYNYFTMAIEEMRTHAHIE